MDRYKKCRLCPHACGVDRASGKRGRCFATDAVRVSRASLHFWEEPPISGSSGSGTIFFANCPLRCVYCQNAAISQGESGRFMSVEELAAICVDLQNQGAMNINFVTPTHYGPSIRNVVGVARARGMGLPVVWNTSGYEACDEIRRNRDLVDIYLTDFKYFDNSLAVTYSGVSDYMEAATRALDEMVDATGSFEYDDFNGEERMTRGVIVRHLLLPGHLNNSKRVLEHLHSRYGDRILVSIMNQYTPLLATRAEAADAQAQSVLAKHPNLGRKVTDDEYEELLDYADALGIKDYFWQDGDTAAESFIPDFE